jgi:hypothetical protein
MIDRDRRLRISIRHEICARSFEWLNPDALKRLHPSRAPSIPQVGHISISAERPTLEQVSSPLRPKRAEISRHPIIQVEPAQAVLVGPMQDVIAMVGLAEGLTWDALMSESRRFRRSTEPVGA